jgi:hypothetical protein
MVLWLKPWESRSLPGLQRTNIPQYDDHKHKTPRSEMSAAFCVPATEGTNARADELTPSTRGGERHRRHTEMIHISCSVGRTEQSEMRARRDKPGDGRRMTLRSIRTIQIQHDHSMKPANSFSRCARDKNICRRSSTSRRDVVTGAALPANDLKGATRSCATRWSGSISQHSARTIAQSAEYYRAD